MRGVVVAASVASAALAVAVAPTPSASAAACTDRDACFRPGDNYSGEMTYLNNSRSRANYCVDLPVPARSVASRAGVQILLSENPCGGPAGQHRYVSTDEKVPSLGFFARSVSWCPSC